MKGKRWLSLALALVMVGSLAACSGRAGEPWNWEMRTEPMTQEEADTVYAGDDLVTIKTSCGKVTGIQFEGYREFRGIRYATAERFEEPVQVTKWEGTYDATKWGDRCIQPNSAGFYVDILTCRTKTEYSEDCLNLNIWTPNDAKDCPVLVFVHGGSFTAGSNCDPTINGEAYAAHGIVTVSINYRLGPFQNVCGDGYSGNLHMNDQVAALKWIRDNIGDYGGDGSNITLSGESAGAIAIQNLLASPLLEEGLVDRAIMMSGGGDLRALGHPISYATAQADWAKVKKKAGVSHIDELKEINPKVLQYNWSSSAAQYTPIINDTNLPKSPGQALADNTILDIPVMIGMLSEDMWPHILYQAAVDYAARRSADGGENVYLYYFDHPVHETFLAYHAADVPYFFGTLYATEHDSDEVDYRISHDMIDYVANFCKNGDPNGEGLPQWTPATGDSPLFLNFGDAECSMVAPDENLLKINQATRSPFPY